MPSNIVEAEIVQCLASGEQLTPREIAVRLKLTNATVRDALNRLYKAVRVNRVGEIGYYKYMTGEQGELF